DPGRDIRAQGRVLRHEGLRVEHVLRGSPRALATQPDERCRCRETRGGTLLLGIRTELALRILRLRKGLRHTQYGTDGESSPNPYATQLHCVLPGLLFVE